LPLEGASVSNHDVRNGSEEVEVSGRQMSGHTATD